MPVDEGSVAGAAPIVIQVLANDTGDGLKITEVSQPAHGTAVITDIDQTITYTPQSGYLGLDTFSYTAADVTGQAETALVEVDVRLPPITIVGNPWSAITTTPVVIPVLDNDIGIGLEVVAVTDPPHGVAVISGGSLNARIPTVITQGPNRLAVCFLAASDDVEVGAATGATGGTWVERHQRLSGSGADSVVTLQTAAMDAGGIISGGDSALAAAATWVTRAFALVPAVDGVTPSFVSFGAIASQVTSPLAPSYPAVAAGDLLLLHMVVRAVNGTVTTPSGFTLLWGPNDASAKTIRSWIYGRIANGTETGSVQVAFTGSTIGVAGCATIYRFPGAQPVLEFEGEGTTSGGGGPTVTYTADAAYTGPDSFMYTAQDDYGQQGSATISVQVLASAPTVLAVDDNAAATAGVAKTLSPLANDRPNTGTIDIVTAPTSGTATITDDAKQVVYTAPVDFSGIATFDYTMNDGGANTDVGTVTVTVGVPEAFAIEDHFDATAGVPQDLPVLTNDVGSANLTITSVTTPDHGGTALAKSPDNKLIAYTPPAGYSGPETFSYTVNDGLDHLSTALVTVEVSPPNIQASPDIYSASAGVMKTLTPLENDYPDTGVHISNVGAARANITIIDSARGPDTALNYTAPPEAVGVDEFQYTISDASGNESTARITVNVSQIPFTPTRDVVTTAQDKEVTFSPLGNDGGTGVVMVAIGSTDWVRSAVVLNDDTIPPVVANNDGPGPEWRATAGVPIELPVLDNDTPAQPSAVIIKASSITGFSRGGSGVRSGDFKRVVYTPPATAGIETFTYIATDGTTEDGATVSIDVALAPPVVTANPDPGVGNPALIATVGVQLEINPLANDTPTTGLHISFVQSPTQRGNATINPAGNRILYTGNSVGSDVFNYTVSDALTPAHTSTSSVTLTVRAAPTSVDAKDDSGDAFRAVQETATLLSPLANDTPTTGLKIKTGSLTAFSNGGSGVLRTSDTQVLYTSAIGFVGTETFRYIATDGINEDSAQVSVVVSAKPGDGNVFATLTPTIGLTRAASKIIRPTTAQLKNLQKNNADAEYGTTSWNNIPGVDADGITLELRGRKFYHHSLTPVSGQPEPGLKTPIRPQPRNGLCLYGAELIGEQILTTTAYNSADYFSMKTDGPKAMDDNGVLWSNSLNNGEMLVEHCIFRGQFDGLNTKGNGGATNCLYKIRECYADEQIDEFMENDSLQRLWFEGLLVDGCGHFLSMRPGNSDNPNPPRPPNYSVVANRVKLRQCLVRCRGVLYTRNNGAGSTGDAFKPYAKRSVRFDINNPTASFNWLGGKNSTRGFVHGGWFKGSSLEQVNASSGTTTVVDCKDSIFAFESQGNTFGQLFLPPGTYENTHVCFLPDMGVGAVSPGRDDFRNASFVEDRTGVTMHWGSDARSFWLDNRSAWITARSGFTNTAGLLDFPFAHT